MAPKRKRQAANGTSATASASTDSLPNTAATGTDEQQQRSKRTRAGSRASEVQIDTTKDADGDEQLDDEVAAIDEAERDLATRGGENGEAGKMRMAAPPKAGLIDPVGYKTNPPPVGRPVRVYADGVFDLFHLGHMRALQQAKMAFPDTYLLVGVTGNSETHRRKGLTVLSAAERAESVRNCKWVDEVVEDCPWIVTPEFLEQHKIDYVAHDDLPYGAAEGDDIYKPIKEAGKFLVTQRTEGVSTTGIITKIVRDYESYIARQLQRGESRKELNISWLKKNELDIKRHVKEVGETIRNNWSTTGQELGRDFRQFWMGGGSNNASRPASPAPGSTAPSTRRGRKSDSNQQLTSPTTPATAQSEAGHALAGTRSAAQSPGAWSRFSIPGSSSAGGARDRDFAAGYAMGLLGSVRGWMQRNRRNLADSNGSPVAMHAGGDSGSDEEGDHPVHGDLGVPSSVVEKLEASAARSSAV